MSQRHPRPPGSGRKPGRPKLAHVASSVERAEEYLRQTGRNDLGELRRAGSWALIESEFRDPNSANPRRKQHRILTATRRLRALLPAGLLQVEDFRIVFDALEALSKLTIRGDERRHFAWSVLHKVAWNQSPPLPPKALLALAIALGCETPKLTETGQSRLYEAWKKRHALVTRSLPNASALELARAMLGSPHSGGRKTVT